MKISYLSGSVIPSTAANSVHVMKMCNAFAAVGCQPLLVAVRRGTADPEHVRQYYGVDQAFPIRWLARPAVRGMDHIFGFRAAGAARSAGSDLVYGRHIPGCWAAAVTTKIPVVFEAHHPIAEGRSLKGWMFRRLLKGRNFLGMVVITRALEMYFLERYPALRGRIYVAADGADLPAAGVRPALARKEHSFRVGYVGHLYAGRGVSLIVELARRCPWAEFHLVGGTEVELAYWRGMTRDISTITVHGFKPPAETERYRLAMDVLVAPYQTEVAVGSGGLNTASWMSPLKIFEYMATGKAIVASDLPPLREVLSERNAVLVTADRIDEWVHALSRLRDPALRARLGRTAQRDLARRYTWRRRAELICEHVQSWKGGGVTGDEPLFSVPE